jgi:hypothetical protein
MWRYVVVQNLASLVLDDKEAIQHSERHRRQVKNSVKFGIVARNPCRAFGSRQ